MIAARRLMRLRQQFKIGRHRLLIGNSQARRDRARLLSQRMRLRMRQPSYFSSCSQSPPSGAASTSCVSCGAMPRNSLAPWRRRKVLRQQAPLAAGSGNIQDRVDNSAQVGFPRTPQTLDRWRERFNQPPLHIGR
jgi:hypothetical protein